MHHSRPLVAFGDQCKGFVLPMQGLCITNARVLYYQCKGFVLLLQPASHNLDCRIRRGSRIDRQPIQRRSSTNGNGPHEFPMLAVFVATHR
jgi:hypothetical protein